MLVPWLIFYFAIGETEPKRGVSMVSGNTPIQAGGHLTAQVSHVPGSGTVSRCRVPPGLSVHYTGTQSFTLVLDDAVPPSHLAIVLPFPQWRVGVLTVSQC